MTDINPLYLNNQAGIESGGRRFVGVPARVRDNACFVDKKIHGVMRMAVYPEPGPAFCNKSVKAGSIGGINQLICIQRIKRPRTGSVMSDDYGRS